MANSAFEAITSRQAWYAGEDLAKCDAVQFDAGGVFKKADGSKPFAGIVEYGGASGEVVTVVRGVFPGVAGAAITAGDYLVPGTGATAGQWVKADNSAAAVAVIGVALTDAASAGDTVSVQMLETPFTQAKA